MIVFSGLGQTVRVPTKGAALLVLRRINAILSIRRPEKILARFC